MSDPNAEISDIADPKQLTTKYKKNGSFDRMRKQLLENFKQSDTHANLLLKLKVLTESKIKQDPSILMKNKGKVGALIQGEIINQHSQNKSDSSILGIVDKDIQDKLIDSPEFHKSLKSELKDVKRKLLGISDEDYEELLRKESEREMKEQKEREEQKKAMALEKDYKNNLTVKQLHPSHKVTKAPRINLASSWQHFRDGDGSSGSENGKKVKEKAFLMY